MPTLKVQLQIEAELESLQDFPGWLKTRKTKENKELLLALAKEGKDRPSLDSELGKALKRYTYSLGVSFDIQFDNQIRSIRPDWFREASVSSSAQKKRQLIELAKSGGKRPTSRTQLGKCLISYLSKTQKTYDPNFESEIKLIRPDWFLKKEKIQKTVVFKPNKWVKVAEELALKNNGELPPHVKLRELNLHGLNYALVKYPEQFAHIKKAVLLEKAKAKSTEEHVKDAEKLCSENQGFLPNPKWLQQNGYTGLDYQIRKYPNAFAHIKQKRLKTFNANVNPNIRLSENKTLRHESLILC